MRELLAYGLSGLASCLTYVSSLINLSLFTGLFALWEHRNRKRLTGLVATWALVGLGTVLLLYSNFTLTFFREILPNLWSGTTSDDPNQWTLGISLRRLPVFFGPGFLLLAAFGALVAKRRGHSAGLKWLSIYAVSFALLLSLRVLSPVFKDLKEILFVGPLIAICAALGLVAIQDYGVQQRWARPIPWIFLVALFAFSCFKLQGYWRPFGSLAGLD